MIGLFTVLEWRKDANARVRQSETSGRDYLLNTEFMIDIHSHGAGAWFFYIDNPANKKDNAAYVEIGEDVDYIRLCADDTPLSNSVDIDVYPHNDLTETPETFTVPIASISRAWAHFDGTHCWVNYCLDGWDNVTVLCNTTLAALGAVIGIYNDPN